MHVFLFLNVVANILCYLETILKISLLRGRFLIVVPILSILIPFCSCAEDWEISGDTEPIHPGKELVYQRKSIRKNGETGFFSSRTIQLVWFDQNNFHFKVVDNGGGEQSKYANLAAAMQQNGCVAGANGGFFVEGYAPLGLMISNEESTGKWGKGKLLTGAILTDVSLQSKVIRRAEYQPGSARELVQAGPLLVDGGTKVKGLATSNARRRTFVLYDGRDLFAIGLSDSFTLDELAEVLSQPGLFGDLTVFRAINLDGGTSSGFFCNRGPEQKSIHVEPFKRVRNYLGIVPKVIQQRSVRPILRAVPVGGQ